MKKINYRCRYCPAPRRPCGGFIHRCCPFCCCSSIPCCGRTSRSPRGSPFHSGGTLYVPARALLEYFPIELQWNNTLKQLTLSTSWDKTILTPGSASMKVTYTQTDGGYQEELDSPVLLKAGHVYIAAVALDSLTGAVTELNPGGSRVNITPGSLSTTVRVPAAPLPLQRIIPR
ncbi:stalk domain-containing protein [Paenibacillus rhizoplanae]